MKISTIWKDLKKASSQCSNFNPKYDTMLEALKRNWWIWGIHGLMLIAYGLVSLNLGDRANNGGLVLSITGMAFMGVGLTILLLAFRFRDRIGQLIFWILIGLLDLVLGGLIVSNVSNALRTIENLLGVWMVISGFALLYVYTRPESKKAILLINSFVIMAFGFILIFDPFNSPEVMNLLMGFGIITLGLFILVLSFRLKPSKAEHDIYKLKDDNLKEKAKKKSEA